MADTPNPEETLADINTMAQRLSTAVLTIGEAARSIPTLRYLLQIAKENNLATVEQLESFGAICDVVDLAANQLMLVADLHQQMLTEEARIEGRK